jgi:hypothetical protein
LTARCQANRPSTITVETTLSLSLFMFRVDANHTHHAFAVDNLALVAHLFYGSSHFHLAQPSKLTALVCIGKLFALG